MKPKKKKPAAAKQTRKPKRLRPKRKPKRLRPKRKPKRLRPKRLKPAPKPIAPISTEAKLNSILKWIIRGDGPTDVFAAIAKHYPADKAQDLVDGVMAKLRDAADFDQDIVIGWCFEATRDVYRRMIEAEDYAGALRAIKQIAEIAKHVPSSPNNGSAGAADPRPIADGATPASGTTPVQPILVVRSEADAGSGAQRGGEPVDARDRPDPQHSQS